ncbi:3-oxoacyl-(acyl-carrier-protein) reductase [Colletotrichum scovillei]|uniref:3-oxoacyl-(Acyl-carrier-protein) reductase n=1 Tax=Colletotrichum scovillei TaxID=1209932 RepID=A0A9P7U6H3_9PEZI|nr:3-oxoacyl-(acyl-carrier-protein) reductase [Colletotrichum scovillei]KAG7046213.1 3-oxoacyl-(acyl-carrier-protein) reductase [Colletotrichum scovillei]KAG7063560.1 3-oxoacyl-(acyl-carrier-protein) reductase [Colletotrichum scovillei]
MSFNDKTIAMTGAASVIGRTTAVHLASRGTSLATFDVQSEALKAVADELKTSVPIYLTSSSPRRSETGSKTHRNGLGA